MCYIVSIFLLADQCGAEEICMNCHDPRSLSAGTTDAVKLARFFDKVIERKYYPRGEGTGGDKRRYNTTPFTSPFTTPFTSPLSSPTYPNNVGIIDE